MMIARRLFVASLLFVLSTPVFGDCVRYECKRGQDTASCWERMGPLANNFTLGSSCQEVYSCIWFYDPNSGWGSQCSYNCQIEQCYEV